MSAFSAGIVIGAAGMFALLLAGWLVWEFRHPAVCACGEVCVCGEWRDAA